MINSVDPRLDTSSAGPAEGLLAGLQVVIRIVGTAGALLGGLTLLLAMIGLYGVLSFVVSLRTREIGVRMALGATRSDLLRLVLLDGLRPVAAGVVLGMLFGFVVDALVRTVLPQSYGVVPPLLFVLLPIPFVLAAAPACLLPALRAARLEPSVALREL